VQAGTALKIISGAVPFVGGLAGVAGAALEAGDRFVQTRRLVKVIPCHDFMLAAPRIATHMLAWLDCDDDVDL